ncbi:hypothetical protein AB0N05_03540 [Nocardia sp. NPDC051030]|uniref:hypothetical protein n=1 Tax=Nocardia sp. NPDC051030 TaxID=3155162 RepID=UPI003428F36E
MDADFSASLGDTLNARQANYRLTHPDTPEPGTSQNPVLTGIDTGTHATLGRTGLDQPEQPVQWASPYRPDPDQSSFNSAPTPEPASFRSVMDPDPVSPRPSIPEADPAPRQLSPDPAPLPNRRHATTDADPIPPRATWESEPSQPVSRRESRAESRAAESREMESRPPAPRVPDSPSSDAPAPNIDLHQIMRLLLTSHDLEVAALEAESGEITVSELARAARRTRSAAVDLVAAWYGGPDQMRKFGEVLLQAAAETA